MAKKQSKFNVIQVIIALGVVIGLIVWALLTQQSQQKAFTNYDDCAKNGGKTAIATTLSTCVGRDGKAFLQYSAQNLPRILGRKTTDKQNNVVADGNHSADLVAFLKKDDTGCDVGYYKVIKEVAGRFAKMHYGCDGYTTKQKTAASIIAIKLADGWSLLSPTDQMMNGVPSCLMVDMFRISKSLESKCFENTGYNDGTLREVTYQ